MKFTALLFFVSVVFAGCSTEVPEWHAYPATPSAELAAKKSKAESTRDTLAKNLMAELKVAMKEGGPKAGIKVCNEKAPVVLKGLNTSGLRIGRTSFKLRNPGNRAPEWARPFVDAKASKSILLVDSKERLHALYPIFLKVQCVACHGKPDQISDPVQEILNKRYPEDQAHGFAPDDLRGWFWIEVD